MASWFVDLLAEDATLLSSNARIPVNVGTVPTGYAAYAQAVADAIFGTGLMSVAGVKSANLVIPLTFTPIAPFSVSEIRLKWQASMQNTGRSISRFSVPGANSDVALIAAGTKWTANLTLSQFTAAIAALINTGGTVHMVEPDEGTLVDDWSPVLRMSRSRKRPREAGSR